MLTLHNTAVNITTNLEVVYKSISIVNKTASVVFEARGYSVVYGKVRFMLHYQSFKIISD